MPAAVCFWACTWLKLKIGYDDSLDVFGVHGIGGFTGTLLAGVFAVGALSVSPEMPGGVSGLLEGNPQQVMLQLYGIAVTLLWSGAMTFIILKVIGALVALRVRNEDEVMGLDVSHARRSLAISAAYFLSSPYRHWRDFKRRPPAETRLGRRTSWFMAVNQ